MNKEVPTPNTSPERQWLYWNGAFFMKCPSGLAPGSEGVSRCVTDAHKRSLKTPALKGDAWEVLPPEQWLLHKQKECERLYGITPNWEPALTSCFLLCPLIPKGIKKIKQDKTKIVLNTCMDQTEMVSRPLFLRRELHCSLSLHTSPSRQWVQWIWNVFVQMGLKVS